MRHTPSPHVHRRLSLSLVGLLALSGTMLASAPALAGVEPSDCYSTDPGTVGAIDHPTDAGAIVLSMSVGGGFVPFEVAFIEQNPLFTLYGNDTAIFQPASIQESLTDPWPPFQCVQLTPDQVDELLAFALLDGGLADASASYLHPLIVDVPFTTFTIDADGIEKTVSIQALGFDDAPDAEARAGFSALADLLTGFADEVEGEAPYDVAAYAALLTPAWGDTQSEPLVWPWPELTLDDFPGDENARFGSLTPDQAAQIATIPNGGQVLIAIGGPDGEPLTLSLRPMLPEAGLVVPA